MKPYQERVIAEKAALDQKRKALLGFIGLAPEFRRLPPLERSRLNRQLEAMTLYSNILDERINCFPQPDNAPQPKPKLKRDWVGRRVRLVNRVVSRGGKIFEAGTVMNVIRNHSGLHLTAEQVCDKCGLGDLHWVRGVSEDSVELLP